jgi:transketolase
MSSVGNMNMKTSVCTVKDLEAAALSIRRNVLDMVSRLGRGYLQQGLGAADLFTMLFFDELQIDENDLYWPDRDRFILSTAHNSAVFYATLAERGFLDRGRLVEYTVDGSALEINVSERLAPLVEATCGSLGQGLSVGVGIALAARRRGLSSRVYVLLGDAEMQEGQVWEAAMSAASHKLDNLCLIVDINGMQAEGAMEDIVQIHPISEKWQAFGWHTISVDGHSYPSLRDAFKRARETSGYPTAIIAKTTVGKGVPFLEGTRSHNMYVTAEVADRARTFLQEVSS